MLRKLLLTSVIIYIKAGTILQVMVGLLICFGFLIAHIKYQPFNSDEDDNLQSISLGSSVLTLVSAAMIMDTHADNAAMATIMILAVNLAVVGFALYVHLFVTLPVMYQSQMAQIRGYQQDVEDVKQFLEKVDCHDAGDIGGIGALDFVETVTSNLDNDEDDEKVALHHRGRRNNGEGAGMEITMVELAATQGSETGGHHLATNEQQHDTVQSEVDADTLPQLGVSGQPAPVNSAVQKLKIEIGANTHTVSLLALAGNCLWLPCRTLLPSIRSGWQRCPMHAWLAA